jgi:hypothetical protein
MGKPEDILSGPDQGWGRDSDVPLDTLVQSEPGGSGPSGQRIPISCVGGDRGEEEEAGRACRHGRATRPRASRKGTRESTEPGAWARRAPRCSTGRDSGAAPAADATSCPWSACPRSLWRSRRGGSRQRGRFPVQAAESGGSRRKRARRIGPRQRGGRAVRGDGPGPRRGVARGYSSSNCPSSPRRNGSRSSDAGRGTGTRYPWLARPGRIRRYWRPGRPGAPSRGIAGGRRESRLPCNARGSWNRGGWGPPTAPRCYRCEVGPPISV